MTRKHSVVFSSSSPPLLLLLVLLLFLLLLPGLQLLACLDINESIWHPPLWRSSRQIPIIHQPGGTPFRVDFLKCYCKQLWGEVVWGRYTRLFAAVLAKHPISFRLASHHFGPSGECRVNAKSGYQRCWHAKSSWSIHPLWPIIHRDKGADILILLISFTRIEETTGAEFARANQIHLDACTLIFLGFGLSCLQSSLTLRLRTPHNLLRHLV